MICSDFFSAAWSCCSVKIDHNGCYFYSTHWNTGHSQLWLNQFEQDSLNSLTWLIHWTSGVNLCYDSNDSLIQTLTHWPKLVNLGHDLKLFKHRLAEDQEGISVMTEMIHWLADQDEWISVKTEIIHWSAKQERSEAPSWLAE